MLERARPRDIKGSWYLYSTLLEFGVAIFGTIPGVLTGSMCEHQWISSNGGHRRVLVQVATSRQGDRNKKPGTGTG